MPGTGHYFAKVAPTQVDDTQSGAPAGQVITLVTGGLGTADAFKGGYVQATLQDIIWEEKASQLGAETNILALAVHNGKLYGGTDPNGKLYEWNGTNAWVEVAPKLGAETGIRSLAVYNGKLYGGTLPNGKLYEWNGTNAWVEVAPQLGAETFIFFLAVHNGKLYGGTNPNGKLYEWNGTNAWVEVAPQLGAETVIPALAVHNGKLYGGTSPNGKLYEWNGTNAWVEVAPQLGAETAINALAVHNGKLYGGTSSNGKLYEWNGTNAWVEVAPKLGAETVILALAVHNEKLYGGTLPNGKLYEWNGTNAWVEVAPQLGAETNINALAVHNGKLYGGTSSNAKLYEWSGANSTRSIVSHTDDTITLEGTLTSWVDGNDLDIFDAWSTIQAALDQLWTDQGAAAFTFNQYVRVFAGTYDENVVPNASLLENITLGFALFIEGDPDDDRNDIKLAPSAGHGIDVPAASAHIRHMWIDVVAGNNAIRSATAWNTPRITDCRLTGVTSVVVSAKRGAFIEDCAIALSGDGAALWTDFAGWVIRRSTITGPGKATSTQIGILLDAFLSSLPSIIEGVVVSGFRHGIRVADSRANGVRLDQVTIHDCEFGLSSARSRCGPQRIANCIFTGCTENFRVAQWPEEIAAFTGPVFVQRNNIYHDYTDFANNGAGAKTYAEWIALGQVDAAGDLDQTNPLLTDPDSDDFSLQAASPAINTGHGSGVVADYLGTAFNPNHPDIGGWSSGAAAAHLTPVLDSWANVGDGETVTLAVSNVEGSRTVHAFYRLKGSAAAFVEAIETRVGPGDLDIGGLSDGETYEIYVVTSDGTSTDMPSLPSNMLIVTPSTVTAADVVALEGQGGLDFQLDDDCEDIEIVNLDLALVDGTVQVKQALCIALRMFRGEWFLDAEAGVPYYQNILVKTPNISEINSILKVEILKVAHVNKILEFSSTFDAAARELSVSFRVDTDFGPVAVEEVL